LLYAWEQLTYVEIAEVLLIPVGTVRSRIHRVRQSLFEALDGSVPRIPISILEVEYE
jgi:RNA polymerase sigma-70 factor (ECF subfamily)